jgi:hypothetical protein
MAVQLTLLDGDTGGKRSSLELLVGGVVGLPNGLQDGTVTGQAFVWDGTAWVPNPQNSAFAVRIGRVIAPGTGPLLLASASAVEVAVDPGVGNHYLVTTPEGHLSDTIGLAFNAATPIPTPTITGSRAGNAALASLLTALAALGLIIDGTSA